MNDDAERVKAAIDAIAYISSHVPLQRRGNRYVGRCPFHDDRNPSFSVRPDGLFYCFGCGVGGDILRFIELIEGVSFPEALEKAAAYAGVTLTRSGGAGAPGRDRLERGFALLDRAARYFGKMLLNSSKAAAARSYLEERGVPRELWERFGLGFAWGTEDDWTALVRRKGWNLELSVAVGLTTASGRRDRYRERLIFPIRDERGRVRGFGARVLPGAPSDAPKYINSPESPWYHKGQLLYGLDLAAPAWRERRQAILVEGYLDVIRFHELGFSETVAPLGTALTPKQASLVAARARRVVLAFDADVAGAKAALAAWAELQQRQVDVHLLELPPGQDPDDLGRAEGTEGIASRLAAAPRFWEHLCDRIRAAEGLAEKRMLLEAVLERLASFSDPLDVELLSEELAAAAGVSVQAVRDHLRRLRRPQRRRSARREEVDTSGRPRGAEAMLVRYLLHNPAERFAIAERLEGLELHPWLVHVLRGSAAADPGYRQWLAEMSFADPFRGDPEALLADVEAQARRRKRERDRTRLEAELAEHQRRGDTARARRVVEDLQRLYSEGGPS